MEILSFRLSYWHFETNAVETVKSCPTRIGICDFLLNNVFLLFIDQAAKNFGEKNYCSRVLKMLFSTKNSGKGQLKSQQICFAYSRSKREKSDKLQVINRYAEIVATHQVIKHYMSAQAKW